MKIQILNNSETTKHAIHVYRGTSQAQIHLTPLSMPAVNRSITKLVSKKPIPFEAALAKVVEKT